MHTFLVYAGLFVVVVIGITLFFSLSEDTQARVGQVFLLLWGIAIILGLLYSCTKPAKPWRDGIDGEAADRDPYGR
jgi:hypothetical protein